MSNTSMQKSGIPSKLIKEVAVGAAVVGSLALIVSLYLCITFGGMSQNFSTAGLQVSGIVSAYNVTVSGTTSTALLTSSDLEVSGSSSLSTLMVTSTAKVNTLDAENVNVAGIVSASGPIISNCPTVSYHCQNSQTGGGVYWDDYMIGNFGPGATLTSTWGISTSSGGSLLEIANNPNATTYLNTPLAIKKILLTSTLQLWLSY
jgi:hypothetical protein